MARRRRNDSYFIIESHYVTFIYYKSPIIGDSSKQNKPVLKNVNCSVTDFDYGMMITCATSSLVYPIAS